MTPGEQHLEEACRIHPELRFWHEPTLADRVPDFVLWSPILGLVVIEVKDWHADQIPEYGPEMWLVRKKGVAGYETAPHKQALVAKHRLLSLLRNIPQMRQTAGSNAGKPKLPVSAAVYLHNITCNDAVFRGLAAAVPPQTYLFSDQLAPSPQRDLMAVLGPMLPPLFKVPELTPAELQVLEDAIAPYRKASVPQDLPPPVSDLLDPMQAELAHDLKGGHRVLSGPAGSGKSLILAARARFLKQRYPQVRIQIVCYNAELVAYLQHLLGDQSGFAAPSIQVENFHALARRLLETIALEPGESEAAFASRTERTLCEAVTGERFRNVFDALLIDEGQDLEAVWIKALVAMVNPQTDIVLFCGSAKQNVRGVRATFSSMGVRARGRTKLLRGYRCSAEIAALAEAFFAPYTKAERKAQSDTVDLAAVDAERALSLFPAPERHSRKPPQFVCLPSMEQTRFIAETIAGLLRAGICCLGDCAVLYADKAHPVLEPLRAELHRQHGPTGVYSKWTGRQLMTRGEDSVKLTTIHSAKGLEWRVVFLLGLDRLPRSFGDLTPDRERALVYVALTRAQDELYLLAHQPVGLWAEVAALEPTYTPPHTAPESA